MSRMEGGENWRKLGSLGGRVSTLALLPGNAKCSMTSLADTKHIFREIKIYFFMITLYEVSNFAAG